MLLALVLLVVVVAIALLLSMHPRCPRAYLLRTGHAAPRRHGFHSWGSE